MKKVSDLPKKITIIMKYEDGKEEQINYSLNSLRYGDNPHQPCAVGYGPSLKIIQKGKGFSFTNYLDFTSLATASELSETMKYLNDPRVHATVINKHTEPAAFAVAKDPVESYELAFDMDPKSIFGGAMGITYLDLETVESILGKKHFLDVLEYRKADKEAVDLLKRKRKNLRIVDMSEFDSMEKIYSGWEIRRILFDTLLVEDFNSLSFFNAKYGWEVQSNYQPTESENMDSKIAWIAAKSIRSNSFVFVKNGQGMAQCGGQSNREDSAKFAGIRASEFGNDMKGSVGATDSFLYDEVSVDINYEMGVKVLVNPGRKLLSPNYADKDIPILERINEYEMGMIRPYLIVNGEEHPWRVFRH
ncbi:MAG: hypothetical protein ACE5J4_01235 [Candidatus Aenigmatarchaeota archaeon]